MRLTMQDNFNTQLSKHILSSLTSALFYQMMLLFYKRIENVDADTMVRGAKLRTRFYKARTSILYEGALRELLCVETFYIAEVPVAAGKGGYRALGRQVDRPLCNHGSEKSSPIFRKNIQQVAYDLNFSNQSSFGKYFKHITGMSPTDFQKS